MPEPLCLALAVAHRSTGRRSAAAEFRRLVSGKTYLVVVRALCVISVLFCATDIQACSCARPSPSAAASQLAARFVEFGAIVIRAKVLQVHRDAARPDSDTTADIEVTESYSGDSRINSISTASNAAMCGVTLREGEERDFLLTKDGRAELCNDLLLRAVPDLIDEIRRAGKKK